MIPITLYILSTLQLNHKPENTISKSFQAKALKSGNNCPIINVEALKMECYKWFPVLQIQNPYQRIAKISMLERGKDSEVEWEYAKYFQNFANNWTYDCKRKERMGHRGDGGWFMCLDDGLGLTQAPCLIYSFGIGKDWSFDEASADLLPCAIHSFDPTIGLKSHTRASGRIHFHDIGLSGGGEVRERSSVNNKMAEGDEKYFTLSTIMRTLGHEQLIDYMKVDIESNEWQAVDQMIAEGILGTKVRQLGIEFHFWGHTGGQSFIKYIYTKILDLGFQIYHSDGNPDCVMGSVGAFPYYRCYEIYFVNAKLLNKSIAKTA